MPVVHSFLASFLVILRSFLVQNGNLKSMNEITNWCRRAAMTCVWVLIICVSFVNTGFGQEEDPDLVFEVDGVPVYLSEFTYIYNKTNGKQADYSRKSLGRVLWIST